MITVESLKAVDACEAGIEVFAKVYPAGLDPAAWTPEEQLRVLKHTELRKYLGWAWRNNVVPQWSMSKVDLNGTNLTGASLTGADLCQANLNGANLNGASLRRASLAWTDLSGVNLRRANLRGADLTGADLTGADLSGADLTGAILGWTDLRGADLRGAIWDEHEPPAGWRVNKDGRLEKQ